MDKSLKSLQETINSIKDMKILDEIKNNINKMIEEQSSYITMINNASLLLGKNFGYIREAFESISPELYKTAEGKKIIKSYINEVKSNPSLKSLYHIYENIYHADANVDADYFINEAFANQIDKAKLSKGISKVNRILAEGYFTLDGKTDFSNMNDNDSLNESIEYLATTKKTLNNVSKRSACVSEIKKYINENAGKNVRNSSKNGDISSIVESYNMKYADVENADLVKKIINSNDKNSLFEEYKSNCLTSIKNLIDSNSNNVNADRFNTLYEAVSKKTFNEDTLGKDIANFIELKETVENE